MAYEALSAFNDFVHRPYIQPFFWLYIWAQFLITAPVHLIGLLGLFFYDLYKGTIFRQEFYPSTREKAILITGCDTGFGNKLALVLAEKGFSVYAGCLTDGAVKAMNAVSGITALKMDVTKQADIDAMVERINKDHPNGLWAVVNNAGVGTGCILDWCTMDWYKFHMDVNFFAMVATTKACIPLLKKTKGRVINVSSLAGLIPGEPGMSAYSASKHAAEAFTTAIRNELGWWGIKVINMNPAFHATPIQQNAAPSFRKAWAALSEEKKVEYGEPFLEDSINASVALLPAWNPDNVVRDLLHATTAVYAKDQYVTGVDAQVSMMMLRMLPYRVYYAIVDRILRRTELIPAAMKKEKMMTGKEEPKKAQ